MDKNLIIDHAPFADPLDDRIYNVIPRRWGDCTSTVNRKNRWREEVKYRILQTPHLEIEILKDAAKYDTKYDQT